MTIVDRVVGIHFPDRSVVSGKSLSGGCISNATILELDDGSLVFLKTNADALGDLFTSEAFGLQQLAASNTVRVPTIHGTGEVEGSSYLMLEGIKEARMRAGFWETFGRSLAELHRQSTHGMFGLEQDNFIGSTKQPNQQVESWPKFFAENRIGYQIELAKSNGLGTRELLSFGERLIQRMESLLTTDESPCLIHGDLWSGNYLCDEQQAPVLIDPAVYFAHREAEFGMTTLFGGFHESFYAAYNEVYPLESGSDERIEIYRLYHLLNHLNLFGDSYLSGCLSILKKYA